MRHKVFKVFSVFTVFRVFKRIEVTLLLTAGCLVFPGISLGKIDPGLFSRVKPRSIGPANMSGRIRDIDVVAIDRQNPNIIWVGTGEGNPRNSAGVGRGVFKSIDAGKTWIFLGLDKTEKIHRIILDPTVPGTAYAAALGTTWGENPERGVFKTSDGGKTWKKVLYVDQKTGAADLVMAPDNPQRLIAAMWEHRRCPWFFKSGGPGSGLYITSDGGEHWKKLTPAEGLPAGELGRTGIAFAQNKPHIVYALVEAQQSVLLRSEDGGFSWKTVNSQPGLHDRTATLGSKVFMLYGMVADSFEPLTQAAEIQYNKTKILVQDFQEEYNKLYQTDVEEFKKRVTASGVSLFKPFKPINREEKK